MADGFGEKQDNDNTWYGFETEELKLLLASAGVKSWQGFVDSFSEEVISKKRLNRLLAGMYRKGIVSFYDGRLVVAEEQKKITEFIKDSSAVATSVGNVKSGIPYIAYFCRDKAVVLRADIAGSGKVIVKIIDEAEWPGFLFEEAKTRYRISGDGAKSENSESYGSQAGSEIEINSDGLRRAGTELEGCADALKRLSSELYLTLSHSVIKNQGSFKTLDEAQKTMEINGLKSAAMAEVLVKTADEIDSAEKMILDHEAIMKAASVRAGESNLTAVSEILEKAVRK